MQSGRRLCVDDFEDAKSRGLPKAQQRSTSGLHLIETEFIENRVLPLKRVQPTWAQVRSLLAYL